MKLDDLCLPLIERRQPIEGTIEIEEIGSWGSDLGHDGFVERLDEGAAAALETGFAPGVVDENSAHRLRSRLEELNSVLPLDVEANELGVGLVHESRRLKSVLLALRLHVVRSKTAELVVDHRHQRIDGARFAFAAIDE